VSPGFALAIAVDAVLTPLASERGPSSFAAGWRAGRRAAARPPSRGERLGGHAVGVDADEYVLQRAFEHDAVAKVRVQGGP
jgi:hypothetical protein